MSAQSIIERENTFGKISFKEKVIEWQNIARGSVSIELDNVVVIGEYTTDSGLFADDWSLVFVLKNGNWEEVSVYAEGFQELTSYLAKLYNIDFSKPFFANSTKYKTFVRYPISLEGKKLFVLTPPNSYKPPRTFFQSMKVALGLGVYGKDGRLT